MRSHSRVRRDRSYDPPHRSFLCPEVGCGFASLTSANDVWDHAEAEHGTERDEGRCLWEGCDFGRKEPLKYKLHEGQHTGVWLATCDTCGKGYSQRSAHAFAPGTVVWPPCTSRPVPCMSLTSLARPHAGKAEACCTIGAACKCGMTWTGTQVKRDFARHKKRCSAGTAPLPVLQAN